MIQSMQNQLKCWKLDEAIKLIIDQKDHSIVLLKVVCGMINHLYIESSQAIYSA